MATVFAAQDLRNRRRVAIKVLRAEVGSALGAERFLQEIETSANLRHPHILPLFDSGDADGSLFFVMPLVTGETLRSRLDRERQLPVNDALQIAREVAGALAYAHRQGVVHRDIKPENILLESGHAVVADFGIARVRNAISGSATLTQAGTSLGTPQYMSPEQIAGEQDIDGRSDQYSLACVLYEMLAGQPPFTGPTLDRLYYQQLMETPPAIARFRGSLPAPLVAALRRALSKARVDRYANTTEFATDLTAPIASRSSRAVAVLPFRNISSDPENEYFADGITEDVIAQLAKVSALKVVSRTSVMPFKGREHSLRDIADRLAVDALVDGSVRRAGARVRIVAQLIDVSNDQPLWSETFDRELTDIFEIQSEVALRIATALQATLTSDEKERIERRPTEDMLAYQNYLLGRQAMIKFTTTGMLKSIEYYERAIEHDASFAQAHAARAMAYIELGESGAIHSEESSLRAASAVKKALELDPELSAGHAILGYLRTVYEFDWKGAEASFLRAIELSPSNADAWDYYGRLTSSLERFDESLVQVRRAHELDPLTHRVDVVTALLRAGRFGEAVAAGTIATELDPEDARAMSTLGWAHFLNGDRVSGLELLQKAVGLAPDSTLWLGQLGEAYGLAGDHENARIVLSVLMEKSRTQYVSPYHLAYVHTGLGDHDHAIDCLEIAFEKRTGAVYGIRGSFLFKPLHGHPRFTALLQRMNLA